MSSDDTGTTPTQEEVAIPVMGSPSSSSYSTGATEVIGPEIFVGIVTPIGVPGGTVADALKVVMERINYKVEVIHLARQLSRVVPVGPSGKGGFRGITKFKNERERYKSFIDAGDQFCKLLGGDALVALGIERIREIRAEYFASSRREMREGISPESEIISRQLYYFRSLKRPAEIDRLRRIYGNSFFLISAHASRDYRIDRLSKKLASSELKFDPDLAREPAEELLARDESEGPKYGQNVRAAYPKADVFINVSGTRNSIVEELWRFVSILFGAPFQTPLADEQGMAMAYLASLRSAHPQRQVGAAITTEDGSVVAIGCNEVPRAFGGLYWPNDPQDRRDFQLRDYASLSMRQEVLGDMLKRLGDAGFLRPAIKRDFERDQEKFFEEMNSGKYRSLRDSRLMDALEYDRTVHAEMAAITDASRRGVHLRDCTLFCTTLPCHNCARHIVASGIRRVVYIQPFAKSLAKRLHGDAICIDASPGADLDRVRFDPFIGVSPNLYATFFTFRKRMGEGDRWKRFAKWSQRDSMPIVLGNPKFYIADEISASRWLSRELYKHNLSYVKESA
ncbi:MAG TPA: deaminase [Thermoanaerobaculia bacterium]